MTIERINQLRHELELERISYGELMEIEQAFDVLVDSGAELNGEVSDASAFDKLDELERYAGLPDPEPQGDFSGGSAGDKDR